MSNTPQTEAQRLADWADDRAFSDAAYCNSEYNAIADELRRLDALCDERGTNEARMLMRLTEMQNQVDQLQAEAGQFKALAKANADALGASLSERDQLREALQKILNWNSHTTNYAVHLGSNGVRDFYREIARQALATTEPTSKQPLQVEPAVNQQLTTEPVDEREAFEKWAAPNRFDVGHKGEDGSYLGLATGIAWAAWQARAAMAQGVKG